MKGNQFGGRKVITQATLGTARPANRLRRQCWKRKLVLHFINALTSPATGYWGTSPLDF